jgi:hypothetical protein
MVPPPPSSRDAFLPPHIIQQHTRAMRAMGLSHRHAQIKSLSTHLPHGEYQSNLPVPHNSRACDETNGGAAASCRCSVRLLAQRADRIKGMVVGGESAGVGRGSHCLRGGSWSSGPPCECPLAPPPTCRLPLEAACTCPRSIPRIHRGGTPAAGVAPFSLRIWAKQSRLLTSNRAHDGRGGAFIYPWAAKFCSRQSQRPSGPQLVSWASASNSGTGRQAGTEEATPPTRSKRSWAHLSPTRSQNTRTTFLSLSQAVTAEELAREMAGCLSPSTPAWIPSHPGAKAPGMPPSTHCPRGASC